jgi:UDP-N-acetylmuramate-alanine ligase
VKNLHFIGIAGSGMSALAQVARWGGGAVSGSDRFFDRGEVGDLKSCLEGEGIEIFPQDGSGIVAAKAAVSSAAVESDIPDLSAAAEQGIPVLSRGEYLLKLTEGKRSLAVAGTNGKSTTTALLGWILEKGGLDPSCVMGASLVRGWRGWGNARRGDSDLFCFEADESDGVLERYCPEYGVVTNISPDHFAREKLREIFARFALNCRQILAVNNDCPESRRLPDGKVQKITFAVNSEADYQAREIRLRRDSLSFQLSGVDYHLPLPGIHNLYNLLAATALAVSAGLTLKRAAAAAKDFPGLKRRLEVIYSSPDLTVIDDYSHNPAKISAALAAARGFGSPLTVIYQPHGYGPLKRFRRELAAAFAACLKTADRLFLLPVYYAGGTVKADYGSREFIAGIGGPGMVEFLPGHEAVFDHLEPGRGVYLVMGARDPKLSELARRIASALKEQQTPQQSTPAGGGTQKPRAGRRSGFFVRL